MPRTHEVSTTYYHEDTDTEYTIEATMTEDTRGVRYLSNGDPGYPGEAAEIVDWRVYGPDGQETEEYPFDEDDLYDDVYDTMCQKIQDEKWERADYEMDARRDDQLMREHGF